MNECNTWSLYYKTLRIHNLQEHYKFHSRLGIVKSGFGKVVSDIYLFQDIDKSYIQVLTLVENSLLLLKLRIFNKSRLATFYKHQTQRNMMRQTSFEKQ